MHCCQPESLHGHCRTGCRMHDTRFYVFNSILSYLFYFASYSFFDLNVEWEILSNLANQKQFLLKHTFVNQMNTVNKDNWCDNLIETLRLINIYACYLFVKSFFA